MKEIDSKQGCLAIRPRNISFEEATSAAYGGLLAFQSLEKENITRRNLIESPFTLIHPEGIRGVFNPMEIEEILQFTEKLIAA